MCANGQDALLNAILKALVVKSGGTVTIELADVNSATRAGELRVRWCEKDGNSGLVVTLDAPRAPSQQVAA